LAYFIFFRFSATTTISKWNAIVNFIFYILCLKISFYSRDGRVNGRFPPPRETRHRMRVTNLSTRFSWQV